MPGLAFGRDKRLLTARDYQAVFADAHFKVGHKHFLLLARPNAQPQPRLGLVIAKKHIRSAVSRNRIKRVARETFRLSQHKLASLDIVFMARVGLDKLSPAEQTRLLEDAWNRLSRKIQRQSPKPDESHPRD